jgi:diguanylate cyclase (GGDEF)-like protein
MDLDGFKQVNDQLGHHTGDMVLRALGVRLASHLRTEDVVARLGGDEFTALIDDSKGDTQGKNIAALCERLIAAAATPFSTPDGEITVGLSIGIATSLGNIRDADMRFSVRTRTCRGKERGEEHLSLCRSCRIIPSCDEFVSLQLRIRPHAVTRTTCNEFIHCRSGKPSTPDQNARSQLRAATATAAMAAVIERTRKEVSCPSVAQIAQLHSL